MLIQTLQFSDLCRLWYSWWAGAQSLLVLSNAPETAAGNSFQWRKWPRSKTLRVCAATFLLGLPDTPYGVLIYFLHNWIYLRDRAACTTAWTCWRALFCYGSHLKLPPIKVTPEMGQSSIFFSWSKIALQFCVSFCCIMKWISYMYTYIPTLLHLPPTPLSHPSRLSQSTELSSLCYTAGSH